MQYLSVCSGIEAATCAWENLGWQPAGFSEIEPFPCAVLKHHYPKVKNYGDINDHKKWKLPPINLLVGGTPCQSFSIAGLRKGLEDPRGNIMLTYLRILESRRPKWTIWENVPGVLSSNRGRDFSTFITALGNMGYGWAYRVLDAQWFGLAQRRKRVFVVGCLGDRTSAQKVLFESESVRRDTPPCRDKRKEVTGTITGGFGERGIDHIQISDGAYKIEYCEPITGALAAADGPKGVSDQYAHEGKLITTYDMANHHNPQESSTAHLTTRNCAFVCGNTPLAAISFEPGIAVREGDPSRFIPELTGTLRGVMGDNRTAVAHIVHGTQDPCVSNIAFAQGRNNGGENVLIKNTAVRRLTPRECERLQGFPDDYTSIAWKNKPPELCPDAPRYKALGNSMAVPVMRWIGERINKLKD
jgi:DNA (cytosine-5)-methyltransferase 1